VILPFTVLRRLECVLEPTRDAVVEEKKKHKGSKIPVAPYLDGCSQFCLKLADIRIHVNTPISQAQDRLSGDLEEGNKSIRSIAEVTFLRSDFKMFDIISLVCKLEV
jgi:type I restriction-modification system DNA methylase subunit